MRHALLLRRSILLCALTSLTGTSLASAQTAVTGTVRHAQSGEGLPGAHVVLARVGGRILAGATTAPNGRYLLQTDATGSVQLQARFVGFEDQQMEITLTDNDKLQFDFSMTPGISLDPLVVSGSRYEEKSLKTPSSMSVISGRSFEQNASYSTETTLRNTNGVDFAQLGIDRYQISLRGFNTVFVAHTQLRLDHRPATLPNLGVNVMGILPVTPIDIASTEVVLGPASALYGSGVGQGVIHILTKDAFDFPGTSFSVGVGERSASEGAFRHAQVMNEKFAFKVVGAYGQATDWKYDLNDPIDFSVVSDVVGGYDYSVSRTYVGGQAQYRPYQGLTVSANVALNQFDQTGLGSTGLYRVENYQIATADLRAESARGSAQIYYASFDSKDTYDPYTLEPYPDHSKTTYGHVQYALDLPHNPGGLVVGADYDLLFAESSFTGAGGENDDLYEYGGYAHARVALAPTFDALGSLRVDADNVTDGIHFSPRAGLMYQPNPNHAFRLTFNRAYALPIQGELFLDLAIGDAGPFTLRALGIKNAWTFPAEPSTSSFYGSDEFGPTDSDLGISLARAYAAATDVLTGEGGALAGNEQLAQILTSRTGAIMGFSNGIAAFAGEDGLSALDEIENLPGVKPNVTNSIEVGYKGVLRDRLFVGIDIYYVHRKDGISELQAITPFVFTFDLADDLDASISNAFSDEELAEFGLDAESLAALYAEAAAEMAENPVGLVEPVENFDPSTLPQMLFTYINFGTLDYFGADLALQGALTDRTRVFGNAGWLSDNFFDEEELDELGTGFVVAHNAPRIKLKAGLQHDVSSFVSLEVSGRYIDGFEVRSGVHTGYVPSYSLLDVAASFDLITYVPGARINVTALNVLDNHHREFANAPMLGRMIMGRLVYTIP